MRIGCLQFAPQVGDIENNLNRADAVLSKADMEDLDLLVLPELAFTGYNFKSLQDIMPFLEPSGSGITSLWARTMALKYNCVVTVGYPEKVDVSPKWPTGPEYYNSAIVVNGDGETVANYRKSFLYYTDESWALEGKGFYNGWIPGLGKTSIGICMDLNPYKFEAPWHAYEFAFHILEMDANLVIVSMAWMTREEPRRFSRMPNEPDMDTLTYWVTRLEPLIRAETKGEIIVVFCNRTGIEDDATYAGTSAVVGIHDGEVKVYGLLGRGEKELLIVDTDDAPYAKLVYRPEGTQAGGAADELKKSSSDGTGLSNSGAYTPDTSDKESEPKTGNIDTKKSSQNNKATGNDAAEEAKAVPPSVLEIDTQPEAASGKRTGRSRERSNDFVPPPPPLLPFFPGGVSKEDKKDVETKKKPAAPITIPPKGETPAPQSVSSPTKDLPTPSAPSPTPMAVRPKLIIPQSPPIIPQQVFPENPISAASERSERSIQSVKSDESTQTVRSNPRPPEDSTPYPHSGMPLSGYPQKKKIYGGYVSIKSEVAYTPTTPFDNISPVSSRGFWGPADMALRTPISAGPWEPGTPIGRKAEPFPWQAIRGMSRSRSRSTHRFNRSPAPLNSAYGPGALELSFDGWFDNSKTPGPYAEFKGVRPDSAAAKAKDAREENTTPARPPSPKSRNASRSRMHDRSDSALSQHELSAAFHHLESVSQRVNSAANSREVGSTAATATDGQSAAQLRGEETEDRSNITIAASPSILQSAVRGKFIPTPVALDYYRPEGKGTDYKRNDSDGYYSFTPGLIVEEQEPPRAPSRGRQPGPKPHNGRSVSVERHERSTSADSTRNDVLHHRVRRPPTNDNTANRNQSAGNSSRQHRHSPHEHSNGDFERVEAIVCPSCPVHGRRSSSTNTGTGNAGRGSGSQSQPRLMSQRTRKTSTASSGSTGQPLRKVMKEKAPRSAPLANTASRQNDAAYCDENDSGSPIQRPLTAPSTFDPPTPKAMVCNEDDFTRGGLDRDVLDLNALPRKTFVEKESIPGMEVTAQAAA